MWNFVIYYLILAIKTPVGIVRTKSVLIFIGIVLLYLSLFVGNIISHKLWPNQESYLSLLSPLAFTIAVVLMFFRIQ